MALLQAIFVLTLSYFALDYEDQVDGPKTVDAVPVPEQGHPLCE